MVGAQIKRKILPLPVLVVAPERDRVWALLVEIEDSVRRVKRISEEFKRSLWN
jgi:hypothetical protein